MPLRKPMQYSALEFERYVTGDGKTTLVCFVEEWSGPCKEMEEVIIRLTEVLAGVADVCLMDIESAPLVAAGCSIKSIPTLMLFVEGKEVQRLIGVRPFDEVIKTLRKYISGI